MQRWMHPKIVTVEQIPLPCSSYIVPFLYLYYIRVFLVYISIILESSCRHTIQHTIYAWIWCSDNKKYTWESLFAIPWHWTINARRLRSMAHLIFVIFCHLAQMARWNFVLSISNRETEKILTAIQRSRWSCIVYHRQHIHWILGRMSFSCIKLEEIISQI